MQERVTSAIIALVVFLLILAFGIWWYFPRTTGTSDPYDETVEVFYPRYEVKENMSLYASSLVTVASDGRSINQQSIVRNIDKIRNAKANGYITILNQEDLIKYSDEINQLVLGSFYYHIYYDRDFYFLGATCSPKIKTVNDYVVDGSCSIYGKQGANYFSFLANKRYQYDLDKMHAEMIKANLEKRGKIPTIRPDRW